MVTNGSNRYLIKGNWIDIRDSGGKLYAKITPDKKRMRIAGKKHYVDIVINEKGQFELLEKK